MLNIAGLTAFAVASALHTGAHVAAPPEPSAADYRAAIGRGLAALVTLQASDGSFSGDGIERHVGVTGLAGLALLQSGSTPGRGPYADNVERAIRFVTNSVRDDGLIVSGDLHGAMYGHAFATLFLAEALGTTPDPEIEDVLKRAVALIERSQSPMGGWRYQPLPLDADVSVTICQVMALRAARDAGVKVRAAGIDRAVRYVRDCQNPDGGFSYMARQGGSSAFARSAAGLATLYYAGVSEGQEVDRALEYLMKYRRGEALHAKDAHGHFFYGHYYAAQAMFLAGGDYWRDWEVSIRQALLRMQTSDGLWKREISPAYSTAMALMILQMPNRYLPVYTGKGPGS